MEEILRAVRHACKHTWRECVVTHALQCTDDPETLDAGVLAHASDALALCREIEDGLKDVTGCRGQARFVVAHLVTAAVFRQELPIVWRTWGADVHCRSSGVGRAILDAGRDATTERAIGLVVLLRDPCVDRLFPVSPADACRDDEAARKYLDACETLGQFTHMFTVVAARPAGGDVCWRLFMAFQHEYSLADYLGMPRASEAGLAHMCPVLQPVHLKSARVRIAASPYRGRLTRFDITALTDDLGVLDSRPKMDAVWLAAYKRLFCVDLSHNKGAPTYIDGAESKAWSVHRVPIAMDAVARADAACEALGKDMLGDAQ
jgi:hypothetical protein